MKELSETDAWYRLTAMCSLSEHCLQEMSEKMNKWGIPKEAQENILKKLKEEKYIDEERFCRFFVHDKFLYNKWGKMKIAKELRCKRISPHIIEKQLEQIDADEYSNVLKELLKTKKKSIKGKNEYEINGKLIRFALGKGFDMETIRLCINTDEYESMDS